VLSRYSCAFGQVLFGQHLPLLIIILIGLSIASVNLIRVQLIICIVLFRIAAFLLHLIFLFSLILVMIMMMFAFGALSSIIQVALIVQELRWVISSFFQKVVA
jgi:hypothetical protein